MTAPASIIACPNCATKNRIRPVSSGFPRCSVCHTRLPWIVDATADSFEQETTSSVPVLVDFWAPWCGPCRTLSPLVEQLARDHAGALKVVKCNVDEALAVSRRYGVQGIPLLVVIEDGQEANRLVGAVPQARLQAWIEPHLARSDPPAGQQPPAA